MMCRQIKQYIRLQAASPFLCFFLPRVIDKIRTVVAEHLSGRDTSNVAVSNLGIWSTRIRCHTQ